MSKATRIKCHVLLGAKIDVWMAMPPDQLLSAVQEILPAVTEADRDAYIRFLVMDFVGAYFVDERVPGGSAAREIAAIKAKG